MFSLKRSLFLLPVIIALVGCSSSSSILSEIEPDSNQAAIANVNPDPIVSYQKYADLLQKYVNNQGLVAYRELQANRQLLDKFNSEIGVIAPKTFLALSEDEQIALLINAYNSYTLEAIINQKPLKDSIRDIPGVWRRKKFQVVGQAKTLDDIEHGTLRKEYNEPRIHAALVCAAISCPPLRHEPYRGEQLDAQLDNQVQTWLSDSDRGLRIDREQGRVYISSIFKWFGEDWLPTYKTDEGFTGNDKQRAVLNFISNYVSPEEAEYLKAGNYQLQYLDYDWSLNIQPNNQN